MLGLDTYASVIPRVSNDAVSFKVLHHTLTGEWAGGDEPSSAFQTPGRHPSLVGRTSGGRA